MMLQPADWTGTLKELVDRVEHMNAGQHVRRRRRLGEAYLNESRYEQERDCTVFDHRTKHAAPDWRVQ